MKSSKIVYDLNAHIQNLTCEITYVDGNPLANISFDNLGFETITAIKFDAKGYNSFGDPAIINGKETFTFIIQDLNIVKNTKANGIKVNLPRPDISRLELKEKQVCYADGSVLPYNGENLREFTLSEYEDSEDEKEIVNALKHKFEHDFKYKATEYEEGWICGCGRLNSLENATCTCCGANKQDVFNCNFEDELFRLVNSYRSFENNRLKDEKREKIEKRVAICFAMIIVIVVACFALDFKILSGRTTYLSEEQMKSELEGTYTYYSDITGDATEQIEIDDDTVTEYSKYSDSKEGVSDDIEKWNYKRGIFSTEYEKYCVLNNGNIKSGDRVYVKGGYMSKYKSTSASSKSSLSSNSSSSKSSTSSESGTTALKITTGALKTSYYTTISCTIKNTGTKTYKYVKVKGSFKDGKDVVDTDWTYAVGSEGLAPGESKRFTLSVDKNILIDSVDVTILDYDS